MLTERVASWAKRRVVLGILVSLFAVSGVAAAGYFHQSYNQTAYHVYINNKEIGIIHNPDTVRQWLANKMDRERKKFPGQSLQLNKKVTFKKADGDRAAYNEEKTLQQLEREISIKSSAARLVVDKKVIVYGKDKQSIEQALKQLKVRHVKETVKVEAAIVSPAAVFPDGQLVNLLRKRVTALAAEEAISVMKGKSSRGDGQFEMPAAGQLSSYFGERWGRLHAGIDIAAAVDTPVYSADNGRVIFTGQKAGYGNCIIVDHGNGYETLYGHLNAFVASNGDIVEKGEEIAKTGNTGRSTGPHLHFEIRKDGEPVNPLSYIH
jgi:murein DD-endopeptidase MepM/ murein hydrolase activator NlpD